MGIKKYIDTLKLKTGIANCTQYVELAQDVIDNRATKSQEVYLKRHLKICLKCLDELNLDQELKKAIQDRLEYKEVPVGLADTIKKKLAES